MDIGDIWMRVYTPGGKKTHLLSPGDSPNKWVTALCGRGPALGELWRGTGSQQEEDFAWSQELCSQCVRSHYTLQTVHLK